MMFRSAEIELFITDGNHAINPRLAHYLKRLPYRFSLIVQSNTALVADNVGHSFPPAVCQQLRHFVNTVVSNNSVNPHRSQPAKVAEELGDGVPGRIKLVEQGIHLTRFDGVNQVPVQHVPQHRNDNLRHGRCRVVLQDGKHGVLQSLKAAQKNVEVVAAQSESLVRVNYLPNVGV
jgi:hypothetical protein